VTQTPNTSQNPEDKISIVAPIVISFRPQLLNQFIASHASFYCDKEICDEALHK